MVIPNLLLIAGTGNKSGKTSMACRLIGQFRLLNIVSVKITPHFHETTPGLILISEKHGYSVYEETNPDSSKDTSRMLKAGASQVFFAKVTDSSLLEAFKEIMKQIPLNTPIICESPALRNYIDPGLFIIMMSDDKFKQKDISHLLRLPHVKSELDFLDKTDTLPVSFSNGKWHYLKKGF
jgi:hypothetical protein